MGIRTFGRPLAVLSVVLLGAMAPGAADASTTTTLSVAYIPIMPMAQLYVMESEGWAKQAGLDLRLTKFSSGPAMVQAMTSGKYDVMYVGIGPSMVARAKGVPLKVVASAVVEQIALIAQGALAKEAAGAHGAADAIRAFAAEHHRKPKIATLPKGSVPDLVLRYWLERRAKLPLDSVEIVGMGADRVQQALLTRSVDGASILEPIVSIVRQRMPDARILVAGGAMFPDQPGAVVSVSERALKDKPAAIIKLVALHIRATELLNRDPARGARDIYPFLGQGLVPLATIERAVRSPISHFVSDPNKIIAATKEMRDFSKTIGTLAKPVPVDELFDTAIYQAAQRQQ